jgi:hypothetical protein
MFRDKEHEEFFCSAIAKVRMENDPYRQALFYLLGLTEETRRHIRDLYDFNSNSIVLYGLRAPWQTGTTLRVCRLAFNLYNGYCEDNVNSFTPYELFDTEYREYLWIAIRLRYESGFQPTRTYDRITSGRIMHAMLE